MSRPKSSSLASSHGEAYCAPRIDYDAVRSFVRDALTTKADLARTQINKLTDETAGLQGELDRYASLCGASHDALLGRVDRLEGVIGKSRHCLNDISQAAAKIDSLAEATERAKADIARNEETLLMQPDNCEGLQGYEGNTTHTHKSDGSVSFYTFSVRADCGARLFLNENAVLVDRMPSPESREEATSDEPIDILADHPMDGPQLTRTPSPQHLVGGKKYKIRLEAFHTHHLLAEHTEDSVVRLWWQSETVPESIIPPSALFKSDAQTALKISGIDSRRFEMTSLQNGVSAFVGEASFVISDLPDSLVHKRMMRTSRLPDPSAFNVSVSTAARIYVAFPADRQLPLKPCSTKPLVRVHRHPDLLTVLKTQPGAKRASSSALYGVYYFGVVEGGTVCLKPITDQQTKDNPTPFFIAFEQGVSEKEKLCGGPTELAPEFGALSGVSGVHEDAAFGVWRTAGKETTHPWLSVRFKRPVTATAIRYTPTSGPQQPHKLIVDYPGLTDVPPEVLAVPSAAQSTTTTELPLVHPVVSAAVNISLVLDAPQTITGGSFDVLGTQCVEEDETHEVVRVSAREPDKKPTTSVYNVSVSFQSASVVPPRSYKMDNGAKASVGAEYGWAEPAEDRLAKCGLSDGGNSMTMTRLPLGIAFPPLPDSVLCFTGQEDCNPNSWHANLTHNGVYEVAVQIGTLCKTDDGERQYDLQVNGKPLARHIILKPGTTKWLSTRVEVRDHKLVLTADCIAAAGETPAEACRLSHTTIQKVKARLVSEEEGRHQESTMAAVVA
ncbi:unnamed protein product [Vitrella brassicaformis CCMP3155]|uniref:PA14 domain-containing protein n=1 Tax=Vitrella brassicaformis (strain CCMP3155) TaxID=1169540 RepID=A0A0G4EGA3_VITBC|nr:unnamed protein product [Vitrella brassicaformis CCMP3155]|eukprot:CEL95546.1 unnamed protein product [Vitrella brassicaformis CCMP3155]